MGIRKSAVNSIGKNSFSRNVSTISLNIFQKQQLPRGVPRKKCSEICSKFTGEQPCRSGISIKLYSTLRHGCSPVNLLYIFRTPFPKNTSGWLILNLPKHSGIYRFQRKFSKHSGKRFHFISLISS